MKLELVALGLDQRTAGIELRERLAFADADIPGALAKLTDPADPLLEQAAILSTCHRVELYGAVRCAAPVHELASFLARRHGLEPHELAGSLYVHRGNAVAHHLAGTAAGLHSLVVGEAQIQGQVRAALQRALDAGTAGPELRRLFECAISAGRRVRSQTAIGRGVSSIPQASVEFARERRGTLSRATVLLIGTGMMAELAAKQLVKRDVGRLLVLGRNHERASRLGERYQAVSIAPDRIVEALALSDVVISSTGAPTAILHRDQVRRALIRRGPESRPLLVIDLAMPRDVDPSIAGLAEVELHTIDDLRSVVERALANRRAELPAARSILGVEVMRFTSWLDRREATDALTAAHSMTGIDASANHPLCVSTANPGSGQASLHGTAASQTVARRRHEQQAGLAA